MDSDFDIAIIGGGIVGLATAHAIQQSRPLRLVVLEAEPRIASHQTGHNSGVIHSGVYYKPGSLKARLCTAGRCALEELCEQHAIRFGRCGKLIVATEPEEVARLDEIERRGRANGLENLRRLSADEIREFEPHATSVAALHVPQAGIVDFRAVASALAAEVRSRGGSIRTGSPAIAARIRGDRLEIRTTQSEVETRLAINCAGLQSDRIARLFGARPAIRIIPIRGDFVEVRRPSAALIGNLIYPIPDPRFPFLGVHLTRTIDGRVEAGPNAIPILDRHGYSGFRIDARDAIETLGSSRFWRLCWRYRTTGLGEIYRKLSRRALAANLQRLVPEVRAGDLHPARCGIRAQAVAPDGSLVDDFFIEHSPRAIHVLNAPSPAATASLAIGRHVASIALKRLDSCKFLD